MRIQPLFIKQLAVFSALVGLANALFFQINMIGFFVFALFTLIMSYAYGHTLFKKYHLILGFLFTVCTFSVAGSIIYYTLPVTTWTLLLIIAGLLLPALFFEAPSIKFSIPRIVIKHWAVFLVGIIGLTAWWATILQVDITDAVRSPWSFIDPIILLGIALAAGASTLLLYKKSPLGGILTGLTVISAAGLAWAAYSIGYGFDPFIHKATLEHIVNFGSIDPKPFYYIGDYAIELIARLNFGISIQAFNTVFVPILGMMIMTASVFLSFKHSAKLLILFLLPIGAFISTTPQALSYAFAASIAFLSFRYIEHRDIPLWILWMLAITSAIIHPLSGIPALIFLTLLSFASLQSNAASTALITLTSLAGAVSIPTIVLLRPSLSHLEIH